jgi:hypothetical protein
MRTFLALILLLSACAQQSGNGPALPPENQRKTCNVSPADAAKIVGTYNSAVDLQVALVRWAANKTEANDCALDSENLGTAFDESVELTESFDGKYNVQSRGI